MERKRSKSRRSKFVPLPDSLLHPPTQPSPNSDLTGTLSGGTNLLVDQNPVQRSRRNNDVSNGEANFQNSSRNLDAVPSSTKLNGFEANLHLERRLLDNHITHAVSALGESPGALNPQHYISKTSRSTPARASAYQPLKSRSNSLPHQSVRTKNLSRPMAGQYSLRVGQNQKYSIVKSDKQMAQRMASARLGYTHMVGRFAQQAPMSQRRKSDRPFNAQTFTTMPGSSLEMGRAIGDLPPEKSAQKPLEMTTQKPLEMTTQKPLEMTIQKPPEMTIKSAIEFLDKTNENELIYAIAWIQNECLENDEARAEFHRADGAGKLVQLLKSDNKLVQRSAAGALRNVVYINTDNKKCVMDENGLTIILNLLNKTHDEDTIHQLAGQLFELWSNPSIKMLDLDNLESMRKEHKRDNELLKSYNKLVQRSAAGALRNVVYKNRDNKKRVMDENGLTIILNLLNKTHDEDTIHQLAGLLWNLSSDDDIKMVFDENVLEVLTKVILVPFSSRNEEAGSNSDLIFGPKAFLCAIHCLRNLSTNCNHRKNMRQCENLIDSLVSFTTETATKPTPDDESTEICVCILQNLTYEAEEDWTQRTTTCSYFPYRPANLRKDPKDEEKAEERRPLQNSDGPQAAQGLWSDQLVQAYLSLLTCSKNSITLTAALGALGNLTVGKGEISENVAKIIQEENGLRKIKTLLEKDVTLKKPALLLMRNLSRFPELHNSIFDNLFSKNDTKTFLRHLDISAKESPELMPVLCRLLINLSKNNAATASYLSREKDVIDMLKGKHKGRAKRAVEVLKYALQKYSQTSEKDKTEMPHNSLLQKLQKSLTSCIRAKVQS